MILICFTLLAFRSFPNLRRLLKKVNYKVETDVSANTYNIDQPGFHEISSVKSGDSINVKFNKQNLRLFLFLSSNFGIGLKKLNIDGSDALSYIKGSNDQYAFAIDGDQEAIFQFESIDHENHHRMNHTYHNRDHVFKNKIKKSMKQKMDHAYMNKNKRTIKEKIKFMITKHEFNHQDYENYDDYDFNFDQISVILWLLPRDMCGKSSIYEYGSISNLTVEPVTSIISSKTNEEITYSNCIFSPLFNIFNTKSSYEVSIGVKPTESDNYYPPNYKSSTMSIYTDNINNPDIIVNGQDSNNLTFSKPFFSLYTITQTTTSSQLNSPLTVTTYLNRKSTQTDSFNFHNFDIFCDSGSIHFYDSKSYFHDDQIELKISQKCGEDFVWEILALIGGLAIFIFIIFIVLICVCCAGCCACCGFCCCGLCGGRVCCRKKKNYQRQEDGSSVAVSQESRGGNNGQIEQDMEMPLMGLDQYHQPATVYVQQPVYYVPQGGQQQMQQNGVVYQQPPNGMIYQQQQQNQQPNVVVYQQQQQQPQPLQVQQI